MAPPIIKPPFTLETAKAKVQAAEDAWNSRDPRASGARLHGRFRLAQPR